ncbi:flagellar motor switch protein FliG [Acidomonas methanolica]|uniref:flagellar motor switch protein FliG n=1 Tax=Acidomonas methanolica TaxID=437 RepID=UPI00211A5DD7|nr:flagellar motor switch protein FliG [Acidomonas methanolica]MCQ9156270.1 flagellar motor switch protein FliG [Acidomonas methanolica]
MSYMKISGKQKAAIFLLALGEENSAPLLKELNEDELKEISRSIANLGEIKADLVDEVCKEFLNAAHYTNNMIGNVNSAERFLKEAVPANVANQIMEEIRGPSGHTMWKKLGNISDVMLANYLVNEHPQTVCVILGRIPTEQSARVLALFPQKFAMEVIDRIIHMESVPQKVIQSLEDTLCKEFMRNTISFQKNDSYGKMAEIFNTMERKHENRLLESLKEYSSDDAEKIKFLMFTFDDLKLLNEEDMALVISKVDRLELACALKGCSNDLRDQFFKCMSERSGKILKEEMMAMGAVKVKDMENAQANVVNIAKKMIEEGEIDELYSESSDEVIS